MKVNSVRCKRKNTELFFDSFKHFKHNLSNLIGVELPTLCHLGAKRYLQLISTNYKSKYPDMKKIGLIDYDKPKDYRFSLSLVSEEIKEILGHSWLNYVYDENVVDDTKRKNLDSLKVPLFLKNISNIDSYKKIILEILLFYYDSADSIRPYLALLKYTKYHNITKLDKEVLKNILAHTREDILLMHYSEDAYNNLDSDTQEELKRSISYIYNFLQTSMIINEDYEFIVDYDLIDRLQVEMSENNISLPKYKNTRPAKEQRIFRENVLEAYDYKCAITGQSIFINDRCLLEAAHIIPYSDAGSFAVNNGIALSYEMHKMFDNHLFGFKYINDDKISIVISQSKQIKDNKGILNALNNQSIFLPKKMNLRPDPLALQYSLNHLLL